MRVDGALIAGIVTAAIGSVPAIIGALALLKKAAAPESRARNALRSVWNWLEFKGLAEEVPDRIRSVTLRVLEENGDGESDKA